MIENFLRLFDYFQFLISRLHDLGYDVGTRVTDLYIVREKNSKRETKVINMLLFIKGQIWKVCKPTPMQIIPDLVSFQTLFGKEADKLEHANDDEKVYYIIEKESLVNKFISVPKDKGSLNCAAFVAGIVQAILYYSGFVSIIDVNFSIKKLIALGGGSLKNP